MKQGEFFREWTEIKKRGFPENLSKVASSPSLLERMKVTLTIERFILCVLVNVCAFVFFYSLGFEQGLRKVRVEKVPSPVEAPVSVKRIESSPIPPAPAAPHVEVQDFTVRPSDNFFTIQLVTYKTSQAAHQEATKWKEKGFRSFIIPSGKYYQVCIDLFEKMPEAHEKLMDLKGTDLGRLYQDAFVRPVRR